MGHRVAILKEGGCLQQVDTPRNLYDRPTNAFVAGFIGSPAMNLRPAELVEGGAQLGNIVLPLQPDVAQAAKSAGLTQITLGVRPESFTAADANAETPPQGLKIEVKLVEELGADAYVYGTLPGDDAGTQALRRPLRRPRPAAHRRDDLGQRAGRARSTRSTPRRASASADPVARHRPAARLPRRPVPYPARARVVRQSLS